MTHHTPRKLHTFESANGLNPCCAVARRNNNVERCHHKQPRDMQGVDLSHTSADLLKHSVSGLAGLSRVGRKRVRVFHGRPTPRGRNLSCSSILGAFLTVASASAPWPNALMQTRNEPGLIPRLWGETKATGIWARGRREIRPYLRDFGTKSKLIQRKIRAFHRHRLASQQKSRIAFGRQMQQLQCKRPLPWWTRRKSGRTRP